MAKDLVCGKSIDDARWLMDGAVRLTFEGQAYYFCSLYCRTKFKVDPLRYALSGQFERRTAASSGSLPVVPPTTGSFPAVGPSSGPIAAEPSTGSFPAVKVSPSSGPVSVVPPDPISRRLPVVPPASGPIPVVPAEPISRRLPIVPPTTGSYPAVSQERAAEPPQTAQQESPAESGQPTLILKKVGPLEPDEESGKGAPES